MASCTDDGFLRLLMIFVLLPYLVMLPCTASASSSVQFYILEITSGKALTCSGNSCQFSEQTYGNTSQLWFFREDQNLQLNKSEGLVLSWNPNGEAYVTNPDSKTPRWRWENMSLKGARPTDTTDKCLMKTSKVLDCTADGSNSIMLLVHDAKLLYQIMTLIKNDTASLQADIQDLMEEANDLEMDIDEAKEEVAKLNRSLTTRIAKYTKEMDRIKDNMTLEFDHKEQDIYKLKDSMGPMKSELDKVTAYVTGKTQNVTLLYEELHNFTNTTNATINEMFRSIQQQLDDKATVGHKVPANIYDFLVIVLFCLGIFNVADISRRVFLYAISQPNARIQYGAE